MLVRPVSCGARAACAFASIARPARPGAAGRLCRPDAHTQRHLLLQVSRCAFRALQRRAYASSAPPAAHLVLDNRTWARRVERHWLRPRTRWLHGGIARMPGTRHQAQRGCACAEHEPGATAGCKTASIAAAACRAWPPSRRRGPLLTRGVCRRAECAAADTRRQPVGRCPLRAQGWTFPQQARARLWLSHLACRRTRWRRAGAKV